MAKQFLLYRSQENDLLQQHRLLIEISQRLDAVQQNQQLLANNAGIPLEDYSPPDTSWPSTEDILQSLMRPTMTRFDRSILSLALDVPLPISRQSHETRRTSRRFNRTSLLLPPEDVALPRSRNSQETKRTELETIDDV